ncbi:hypothetical protein VNO77_12746 [Canavalia gladiata]|uniref:Uncharacterized protein n=1 Tax=Canavalia gladiata TaxID=3824 RepID=A0AAN9QUK2_CANGL
MFPSFAYVNKIGTHVTLLNSFCGHVLALLVLCFLGFRYFELLFVTNVNYPLIVELGWKRVELLVHQTFLYLDGWWKLKGAATVENQIPNNCYLFNSAEFVR